MKPSYNLADLPEGLYQGDQVMDDAITLALEYNSFVNPKLLDIYYARHPEKRPTNNEISIPPKSL